MIDYSKSKTYRNQLREYFNRIFKPGDMLFDIGYSGRHEASLQKLLGFPVNSLYIHINSDAALSRSRENGFRICTFYAFKPLITGVLREHVFMKLAPSVIGYRTDSTPVTPVFEDYKTDFPTKYVTETVQNAALDFIKDMLRIFGNLRPMLTYRKDDLAFSFEYYLHYSAPLDRKIFACVPFEDGFSAGHNVNLLNEWEKCMRNCGLLQYEKQAQPKFRSGIGWKLINKLLPYGSYRRELVKKLYHKIF